MTEISRVYEYWQTVVVGPAVGFVVAVLVTVQAAVLADLNVVVVFQYEHWIAYPDCLVHIFFPKIAPNNAIEKYEE